MSDYTQLKGAGKSRHLPIGAAGSCLTEADRDAVTESSDMSGPECRRCRIPTPPAKVIDIQFTISTRQLASVLDLARTQAAEAFTCAEDDPALVVSVGTGVPDGHDGQGRYIGDWRFVVNASWDAEIGTLERPPRVERHGMTDRRTTPDRRSRLERRG